MKRYYDSYTMFLVYTAPHDDEYANMFDNTWKFSEMLDYMCDTYGIDRNSITEIQQIFVRKYKLTKDD